MKIVLVGGTVLNQDINRPLSGEIIGREGDLICVQWCDGVVCNEWPADVTLTGNVRFEICQD